MGEFTKSILPVYIVPGTRKLKPSKWFTALFILFLALVPIHYLITESTWIVKLFISANIFAIFAMSWDLLSGYTGQENFGHHFFIGVGGYLVGLFAVALVRGATIEGVEMPALIGVKLPAIVIILGGGVVGAIFGLLIGILCIRLAGPYLALTTLAMGFIFVEFTDRILPGLNPILETHATEGIYNIPHLTGGNITQLYYIVLGVLIVSLLFLYTITRSNYGLLFKAIREDETATKAMGINTTFYKVMIFTISAFFAGIGGTFLAYSVEAIAASYMDTHLLLKIISICIVGGMGTITGGFGGAYFLMFALLGMDEIVRFLADITDISGIREAYKVFEDIFYYAVIIIVMLFMPEGIITTIIKKSTVLYYKVKGPQNVQSDKVET
ncbi:MAG: branched-chain amino acid ABC transporter permease [Deltaproteobacteria bacterium]|nr:branched-chain amino acid ABC transporter permease [Deltaproteobacteria bacterium]